MIEIKINGETADAVMAEVVALGRAFVRVTFEGVSHIPAEDVAAPEPAPEPEAPPTPAKRGRKPKAEKVEESVPNITASPEDRREPDAAEIKDAAVVEEPIEEERTFTHDDVRDALGRYAAKFGMPEAQKNGPVLMGAAKISAIPDDQAALRKAVEGIEAAING